MSTRVLFVCTANICRSPFMEQYSRTLAAQAGAGAGLVSFASAGTHGFTDHPMDAVMGAELSARGIDPSGFRSRRLTRDIIEQADLVLTAERVHRSFIVDDFPRALARTFTLGQLAAHLPRLTEIFTAQQPDSPTPREPSGAELIALAQRRRPPIPQRSDVGDPYGQGPQAAAHSAASMVELLDAVVPALVRSPEQPAPTPQRQES